ncbi:fimbrial protein [Burkholderia ubonensis]|uniref:fimbrial protein n=1 Tax=Burkholderia ubonensis TaxID=101571 RepID=UPI000BA711CE|nr:fimbrial protein [Burkholderia ubonensis]PAK14389.1 fimbrial protein [Burkholderia ubonensis]RQP28598.1 fimbrial protein [Burkholderia ubonensis]RQP31296.1 fimbrial protein [Burkholderia ubonensis]RQP33439.1 fimbrial protein [Burkholderia ubonensis]RQP48792.1 fimbrial protein [Burkholderia ubonensis]
MKLHRILLLAAALMLWMPKSYALICTLANSSTVSATTTVDTTIAVPNTQPKGKVLWRQPTQTTSMDCWVDLNGYPGEYIYLYVNPKGVSLGNDLEIGVTFQGRDYLSSSLTGGKLKTDIWVDGCGTHDTCGWQKVRAYFTYSIFIAKKSPAGTAKEGPMASIADYMALQFDGQGGARPGKSYNITVKGLNKLRYIPCESRINISPATIKFNGISAANPKPGQVIVQTPFTIAEVRTCASGSAVYGINAFLTPVNATLADSDTTLVPSDNPSVGINLLRAENLTALTFRKEFVLTPQTSEQSSTHRFLASLKWRTSTPKLGKFNAGAAVEIYYK